MPTAIVDGKGSGNLAEVSDGRLKVEAVTVSGIHEAAHSNKAWSISASVTSPTASDVVFALRNTGSDTLYIDHISVSADSESWYRIFKGSTADEFTSTVTPSVVNLTFSSSLPLPATVGSGVVSGIIAGTQMHELYIPSAGGTAIYGFSDLPRLVAGEVIYVEIDAGTVTRLGLDIHCYTEEE